MGVSVPFWPVVLVVLLGVPPVLLFTGMGMIFAAGGLAGGPQESRAAKIVHGWLAFAWVLASAFGAFGLAPLWRACTGGNEDFVGSLPVFVDWLVGVGIVLVLGVALNNMGDKRAGSSPLSSAARWLVMALAMTPWAALAAWLVWPLVLWPVHGRFDWPDAATGWTHTGEIVLVLLGLGLLEDVVRGWRKR